jgi:hypothetical protein
MRVKLFWKNDRGILNDLYKDGTFRNWKDCWKDWWSGKTQLGPRDGWQEELPLKKSQELETKINNWLSQNPKIKVVDIKQSASGGSYNPSLWLISVWYEDDAQQQCQPEC